MQNEPQELRLNVASAPRSRRSEALSRAKRLVAEAEASPAVLDAAFAELSPATDRAPGGANNPSASAIGDTFITQLSSQLRQLDEQRAKLAELLRRAND